MKNFFVTGTDTHVGKTLASAILTMMLEAVYWKPIQSGDNDGLSDVEQVKQWTKLSSEHFLKPVYSLKENLSPDQSAKLENINIELSNCMLPNLKKPLIVEGAGGVFVPLNQKECIIDLIKKFNLPTIVVARGTLGTINHTLLTIDALRSRHINLAGIIFSGELNVENKKSIEYWGQVRTLLHIPLFKNINYSVLHTWASQQISFLETV